MPTGGSSVQIIADGTQVGDFTVLSSAVALKTSGLTFKSTNGDVGNGTYMTTSGNKVILGGVFTEKNPLMGFEIDGSTMGNPVVRMDPLTGDISITCKETLAGKTWDYALYADGWKGDSDPFVDHIHTREMVVTDINGNRVEMVFASIMAPSGTCLMSVGDGKLCISLDSGSFIVEDGRALAMYDGIELVTNDKLGAVELVAGDLHCYTPSVADALQLAGNTSCTITLLKDVTEDVYVKDGQTVILDLNGHTITNVADDTVICKGTLTVRDGSAGSTGKVLSVIPGKAALSSLIADDRNGGGLKKEGRDYVTNITVEGGTFMVTAAGSYYVVDNSGVMNINGGVFKTESTAEASLIRNVSWGTANLTITDGQFTGGTSTLNTIKNHTFSTVTISGGTFTNTAQFVIENAGTMTISGGTFDSNFNSVIGNMGYNNTSDIDGGTLSVTGGSFTYGAGKAMIQHFGSDGASIGNITIADSVQCTSLVYIPAGMKISSTNNSGIQMTGSITFGTKVVSFAYTEPIESTSDIMFKKVYGLFRADIRDYSDLLKVYSAGADIIGVVDNISMTSQLVIDGSLSLVGLGEDTTVTGVTSDASVLFEINGGQLNVDKLTFTNFGDTDDDSAQDEAVFRIPSGAGESSSLSLFNVSVKDFGPNAVHVSAGTITIQGSRITGSSSNNGIIIDNSDGTVGAKIYNNTITGTDSTILIITDNQVESGIVVSGGTFEGFIGSNSARKNISVMGEVYGKMTFGNVNAVVKLMDTNTEITLSNTQYSSEAFISGVEGKEAFLVDGVVKLLTPYQVSFDTGISETTIDAVTVGEGMKVTEPTAPSVEGKVLKGWYKDAAFGTVWDFDTDTVTSSMTLYAKWVDVHTLTFDVNGGTPISPVQYEYGQSVVLPTPVWDGHTFNGWSPSIETMPNEDVTVVASWSATPEPTVPKYNVTGSVSVTGSTGSVIVSLLSEGVTMYTTPVSAGSFSISDVVAGIYSMEIASGEFSTVSVLSVSADVDVGSLSFNINAGSTVDTDDDTIVTNGADSESQALLEDLAPGSTVDVTVSIKTEQTPATAEQSTAQLALKQESGLSNIMFIEIDVMKAVTPLGGTTTESRVSETTTVFEFIIPFDVSSPNLTVLRYHEGVSENLLMSTSGADGTFYIDAGFGVVHIFTSKFSTYAIAYGTPIVPDSGHDVIPDDDDYPFIPVQRPTAESSDSSDDSMKVVAIAASIVVIMMASVLLMVLRKN